ncbi:adenylate/guanylate cyclase domain-containing protein [bacterium]|nr:adenylate/guanylate cyclase domain-containing protein [bacterium]
MTDSQHAVQKKFQEHLRLRKRDVTLLFTDIEASSAYWDSRGDHRGRLMIDFHNRLIFPIIKKNRGRVVKTIGDAVMAVFKRPADAVTTSITIQQRLQAERKKDKELPKIKIGIHSGLAIVEKYDVFGDMVNVTKRICDRARGNEILLSTRAARRMRQKDYYLVRGDRFRPKGKKLAMTLYSCSWKQAHDHVEHIKPAAGVILTRTQKWEILAASACSIAVLVLLYLHHIRFLLLDSRITALFILDPWYTITSLPVLAIVPVLLIVVAIFLLFRLKKVPIHFFRLVTGGLGFLAVYLLYLLVGMFGLTGRLPSAQQVLFESKHRFVRTIAGGIPVFSEPDADAEVVRTVARNTLLPLNDISGDHTWYRVLVKPRQYGWIIQTRPATIGIPETRVSLDEKYQFRLLDLYHLVLSIIGFILGFRMFRLKPV